MQPLRQLKIAQPLCQIKITQPLPHKKITQPLRSAKKNLSLRTWEDSFFIEQPEQAAPVRLREVSLRGAHDGLLVNELDEGGGAARRLCQLAQVAHLDLLRLVPGQRENTLFL
jgi:hypothetical protein